MELRDSSAITRFVWISSSMMPTRRSKTDLAGCLIVGPHTGITSRHHIDCSGGVEIGGFTTLAGVRSVIFTHEINPAANCQTVLPVKIGDYCLIGSNTLITPGTRIPDRCQIGMGSVVHGQLPEPETLYAGSPARRIRAVDGPYFHRSVGRLEL